MMSTTPQTAYSFPTDPAATAALFHLNNNNSNNHLIQAHQLPLRPLTSLPLQDDQIDFSNPSVQEYLINNDVLDSLSKDESNLNPDLDLSIYTATTNTPNGLENSSYNAELLLLNTPIAPPNSPLTLRQSQHSQQGLVVANGHCSNNNNNNIKILGGSGGNLSLLEVQVDQFATVQEETTLSLGLMSHLDNLEKQVSEMKRFIATGFTGRDHLRSFDIERQRLYARNYNYQNITEINEPFEMLLRSCGDYPARFPVNGVELKSFSHEEMDALLDEYDLPFNPAMFLHEKQLVYLRFIGANRAIMHRVVD
ncbi:hypothetical protein TWF694_006986 [Orbilia ellipsospora]|uniref:Uncharacterized protein n=1 Tax=Orbilia ellipsospora TaxID=2528407 RepID=A0AAV9XMP9_9PEZI